jgi:hypothetical protein
MRVLLIGFTKIAYMPYMHFYINQLQKTKCDISLIYWDRDGKPDVDPPKGVNVLKFSDNMSDSESMAKKMPHFMRFRKFANKVIKENDFDLFIILHTTPGVLLFDILTNKYPGKYILDYRDFTYENFWPYKRIIHGLVNHSIVTFVSSDAFRVNLPAKDNIYTSHNILLDSFNHRMIRCKSINEKKQPIKIRYWGLIRYAKTHISIIRQIANDDRFEMHFHGRSQFGAMQIQEYCKAHAINNVYFHGEYLPEERYIFIRETDVIQNAQDFNNTTKFAMSNKFYDGAIFYIPQLCTKGSYMGANVTKHDLGIEIDIESDNVAELLVKYIGNLNFDEFAANCDCFLETVINEYEFGVKVINDIVSNVEF